MRDTQQQWEDPRFINMYVLADLVNQPIHITTPDGVVRFVNKAWSTMYRKPLEEAVGRHIHDLLEGEHLNYYLSVEDAESEDLENLSYEHFTEPKSTSAAVQAVEERRQITCLTQTPTYNQMMVTATPIFNDKNEIVCVFTLVQDLTAMGRWRDAIEQEMQKNTVLQRELQYLRNSQADSNLIGNSKAIVALRRLITVVASSDASVLISGESGVGKEVVAKEIYSESQRKDKPFITVNCAAIPENLLESELFGHEKGAFTGAISSKVGLFEMANCGTIMLDEIGEFPLHLQPKLLRVLQEREFRRVGGTKRIPIDVRVIAATNRDLLAHDQNRQLPHGSVLSPECVSHSDSLLAPAQGGYPAAGLRLSQPIQQKVPKIQVLYHTGHLLPGAVPVAGQCAGTGERGGAAGGHRGEGRHHGGPGVRCDGDRFLGVGQPAGQCYPEGIRGHPGAAAYLRGAFHVQDNL